LSEKIITVDQVELAHKVITRRSFKLVRKKGADYSGSDKEDTFDNIRASVRNGDAKNEIQSVLIRLGDKIARIRNIGVKNQNPQVEDESFDDAVRDGVNYILYNSLFYHEQKGDLKEWLAGLEIELRENMLEDLKIMRETGIEMFEQMRQITDNPCCEQSIV
jgi:hypothetical protein